MPGSLQDWFWFLVVGLSFGISAHAVLRKNFLRYFSLYFYLLSMALVSIARRVVINTFGLRSDTYTYVYYYSDALLTVILYFAILSLYQRVFEETNVRRHIRWGGNLLLVMTAGVSYLMIEKNVNMMGTRFVVGLSQNLYFVGVVLTYVLWGAVAQLRETRARIVQLVLTLGLFFSAHALFYAARYLFPEVVMKAPWIASVLGAALPVAWAYTFVFVSEDSRLQAAQLHMPGGGLR